MRSVHVILTFCCLLFFLAPASYYLIITSINGFLPLQLEIIHTSLRENYYFVYVPIPTLPITTDQFPDCEYQPNRHQDLLSHYRARLPRLCDSGSRQEK